MAAIFDPTTATPLTLLALCGSLRNPSYNRSLLQALAELAPPNVTVQIFPRMGDLPLFNPDLDDLCQDRTELAPVSELRSAIGRADGLIIASPEYAHGVTGVMKNALDWLVSCESFVGLPVALLNASPRATHAQAALREVITTMSGQIIETACIAVPLLGSGLDAAGIIADAALNASLRTALAELERAIRNV